MLKKLVLAAVVCLGATALTATSSEAGGCHYGHRYGSSYGSYGYAYRAPVSVSPYAYSMRRAPISVYRPSYRPYSSYRYGYGSGRYGFGYPGYGYSGFGPYRGSGISIGIGF
ncbi:hypothetical protein FYK55_11770 [Roseiconus nitratireducens]|uniref:Uncharacterized protein n=1 Tax=Roseiconus nitratireducens TaxID=2605748 RepID=A0A5M6DBR1_9BACT|nr:hypothetical protein [Roseiconus nitratireducens]KAA5543840.1 hypothetical protein FYK55_11770 [Roseiconus nitratireducens]